jgi:hypothetical protein
MTLVEVMGGLALLATLLVATLLARTRYIHQAAVADRRLHAVRAADMLLTGWHQDTRLLPRAGAGIVPGDEQLAWRTQTLASAEATDLGAVVVQLEIVDNRPGAVAGAPLASVEFLVDPAPPPSTAPVVAAQGASKSPAKKKAKLPAPARPKRGAKK